ncbi:MAG: tRNA uridine-5-carboxymethylaminomethyl(34) synthesis GTPase MnmE [Candidatus Bipolaricaulia bacterium]
MRLNEADTIAAISTPLGEGGIGIVRLSGPRAIEIVDRIFRSPKGLSLRGVPSHTIHYGFIEDEGRKVDEVLVTVMRAPRTYTREDVVEINCHGGIVPLRRVLELVLACGARPAEPGEFTKRAFLNGRITIDQAEAVLDIVRAKTELGLELAMDRLEGRFSRPIRALREKFLELLAGIEVGIDFPDYEEEALPRARLLSEIEAALSQIDAFLEHGRDGRIIREGLAVAIIGRPNVGKSTLLNALLQEERAIVTPFPGTTRDRIEEWIELKGIPFKLIDTAGVRPVEDEVERIGVELALKAAEGADLVLFMLDGSEPLAQEDREIALRIRGKRCLLLLNKLDLGRGFPAAEAVRALKLEPEPEAVLELSAKLGNGLGELKERLVELVWEGRLERPEGLFLLNIRERDLLQRARAALLSLQAEAAAGVTPDLLAIGLEEVLAILGELTGENLTEEVIDRIFANFCVGK